MASCGGVGGGGCQSGGCSRREQDESLVQGKLESLSVHLEGRRCSKCDEEPTVHNGLCAACFRIGMYNKFKLAVTSNAMIAPTDRVLIAYSGGASSRVALQFVHEMQCKSLTSWDASKSEGLPVFGAGVAFVDTTTVYAKPSEETADIIKETEFTMSLLSTPHKELHIVKLESICSRPSQNGRSWLKEILDLIVDYTGKEDFLQNLLMLSLQKIAIDNGYTKLVLGSCASRISRHILSAVVKGQGYSLPADLQYVDARWAVPVVLPLRDCLAQELSLLCRLDGLKTQQVLEKPCISINSLVSSFVTTLQVENPSRERIIVRTAEKLKPFSFNKLSDSGYHEFLPSRIRPKFQNKHDESTVSWILCSICGSPLNASEMERLGSKGENTQSRTDLFISHCCQSCCFQILPKGTVSLERFYSLLPQTLIFKEMDVTTKEQNLLREQIKEYLIDDDNEDDNCIEETDQAINNNSSLIQE